MTDTKGAPIDSFVTGGVISGVGAPEDFDRRGETLTASPEYIARAVAAGEAARARLAAIKHPSVYLAEAAEREREAEAAFLAVDHRQQLRLAHDELRPAQTSIKPSN
jgi:hypothetical protein